jgi:PTS system nitrogen regulatory IIA component
MNIANVLTNKNIFLGLKSGSKREFLQDLAQHAAAVTGIDALTLFDSIMERENLGSTGFGGGTALPHGRFQGLDKVYAFFAKPSYPLDFDSIDNKPVDLVFLLMSPEGNGADHLTALAMLSRLLKDENITDKLRQMANVTEIYALLNEA